MKCSVFHVKVIFDFRIFPHESSFIQIIVTGNTPKTDCTEDMFTLGLMYVLKQLHSRLTARLTVHFQLPKACLPA